MNLPAKMRFRKKQSKFHRLLLAFSDELHRRISQHRERLQSLMWSLSVHVAILASLALIAMPMHLGAKHELVTLEAFDYGDEHGELDSTHLDFPSLEIHEANDLPATHKETAAQSLDQLILSPNMESVQPVTAEVSSDGAKTTDIEASITGLGSDEQRIAEADRRVGAAGGNLKAPIRVSLLFDGDDDLDLDLQYRILKTSQDRADIDGLFEPHINFLLRTNPHGTLDVDANAVRIARRPCENIVITYPPLLAEYTIRVNLFRSRGDRTAVPIIVVVRYGDKTRVFKEEIQPGQHAKTIHTFRYAQK